MGADTPLRRRLKWMLVASAGAIATLLPFTFWLTQVQLAAAAREDLLGHRLIALIRDDSPPFEVDTGRSTLHYYRPAHAEVSSMPEQIATLRPGVYREIEVDGQVFTVHVRDAAPGDRAYLAYGLDFVEDLEAALGLFVLALATMIGLAMWVFARGIVDRALSPLSDVLRQIQRLVPGRRGQRLEFTHPDRELAVILDGFNRYLSELDMLVERERTFAAAASHELRTPLTVIQGAARLVEQVPQVPENVRQRMLRAVRELSDDLDALLALSQVQDSPQPQALRLDEYLPPLADRYAEATSARSFIKWITPQPAHLLAPPGVVNVIFGNLLRNALRAANGGEVVVEVAPDWVAINDSGPGIPETELVHVFEPRFRGHDGGSGMGLYIAWTLCQRYGWRIELSNRRDGGVRALWRFRAGPELSAST